MINSKSFSISWDAPILPSKSLAGIPIGTSVEEVKFILSQYMIDAEQSLYQFEGSPILKSSSFSVNSKGEGGFGFLDVATLNRTLFYKITEKT